jgi:hypothetical protein
MKNYCSLFYYFQLLLLQKKVYYTEDFKELSTAEGSLLQYLRKW